MSRNYFQETGPRVLGPDGKPKRGRPRIVPEVDDDNDDWIDLSQTRIISASLLSANAANIAEPSMLNSALDLSHKDSRSNSDRAVNNSEDPLAIAGGSASLDQNSGAVKPELVEIPGLTKLHLELIYQTEDGKLFCRLCACVFLSHAGFGASSLYAIHQTY
jgi:hypothetical protein